MNKPTITAQDKTEFKAYLRQCTDAQVRGVFENEYQYKAQPDRAQYADMALDEAATRGLDSSNWKEGAK